MGRRPLGRRGGAAARLLAADRPRDRRPACGLPSRGGRHPLPRRPVPGPLRGGTQEVRAVADAGLRGGVHPRPDADAGGGGVRPRGDPDDRPDLRLGPLPARRVPAAGPAVDGAEPGTSRVLVSGRSTRCPGWTSTRSRWPSRGSGCWSRRWASRDSRLETRTGWAHQRRLRRQPYARRPFAQVLSALASGQRAMGPMCLRGAGRPGRAP